MPVARRDRSRLEVDADLDGLAPGRAEIVPLEVGAADPRPLRLGARDGKEADAAGEGQGRETAAADRRRRGGP